MMRAGRASSLVYEMMGMNALCGLTPASLRGSWTYMILRFLRILLLMFGLRGLFQTKVLYHLLLRGLRGSRPMRPARRYSQLLLQLGRLRRCRNPPTFCARTLVDYLAELLPRTRLWREVLGWMWTMGAGIYRDKGETGMQICLGCL